MKYASIIFSAILLIAISNTSTAAEPTRKSALASFSSKPVLIDGVLDDEVWQNATAYHLEILSGKAGRTPIGKTIAYFAWDKKNLYIAAKCFDKEITAQGEKDEMHHYKFGDLIEVFLKPAKHPWYWEMYVTPKNNKTTFYFSDNRKRSTESSPVKATLRVASTNNGTINQTGDIDKYWFGEMAIPLKSFEKDGVKLDGKTAWTIMVGRYDYTRQLKDKELTCFPHISKFNSHYSQDYATLIFAPAKD